MRWTLILCLIVICALVVCDGAPKRNKGDKKGKKTNDVKPAKNQGGKKGEKKNDVKPAKGKAYGLQERLFNDAKPIGPIEVRLTAVECETQDKISEKIERLVEALGKVYEGLNGNGTAEATNATDGTALLGALIEEIKSWKAKDTPAETTVEPLTEAAEVAEAAEAT